MIQVDCSCGKTLSVRPDLAGRRVKCPKCAATLTVPSPADPPSRSGGGTDSPFDFGSDAPTTATNRGLSEAKRLAKYWRERNGGESHSVSPREVSHRIPKGLKKHGRPESAFLVGAVPSQVSQYGPFVCGPILLASICTAAYFFGIEEAREDYFWVGLIAIPIGIAAIIGWVFFARAARVEHGKMALLYEEGVAAVYPGEWHFYHWDEIEEVELKPETRNIGKSVVFGHKFKVKPFEGESLVFGMEYQGVIELGLTVMERASAAGAKCTGHCRVPA